MKFGKQLMLVSMCLFFCLLSFPSLGEKTKTKEGPYTVLITGANRGLGLALTKKFAENGWNVFVTSRYPAQSDALNKLVSENKNITIIKLNVASEEEIAGLQFQLEGVPIDLLINNAGIMSHSRSIDTLSQKEMLEVFSINAIAPLLISRALLPNLKLGRLKTILCISSSLASISKNDSLDWNFYGYKASKAALNMLMRSFMLEPRHSDIKILLVHPGSLKTDMGGKDAVTEPSESADNILKLVTDFPHIQSGSFIGRWGNELPW